MSYFLIGLIVLVALSPLLKAMPTRRQRLIANLRQTAAIAGMTVQLRPSPLEDKEAPLRAFYGRRRGREDEPPLQPISCSRSEQGWRALEGHWPRSKLDLLEDLPGGVSLVWEELQSTGVFWDERGDREDVLRIDHALKALLANRD
jgi:hypothetical protein